MGPCHEQMQTVHRLDSKGYALSVADQSLHTSVCKISTETGISQLQG